MQEHLKLYEDKMEKSLDVLLDEYASIRAGRANPHVLDRLRIDYYGTPTPLQQVGNVSVPEARMIVIQPWEKSLLKEIEKAILVSDLGINPTNDGNVIRLVFPELTEERRKDGQALFAVISGVTLLRFVCPTASQGHRETQSYGQEHCDGSFFHSCFSFKKFLISQGVSFTGITEATDR